MSQSTDPTADPTNYHNPAPVPSPEDEPGVHHYNGKDYATREEALSARDTDDKAGNPAPDRSISFSRKGVDSSLTSAGRDAQEHRRNFGDDPTGAAGAADIGSKVARPADTAPPPRRPVEVAQDSPLEAAKKKEAARRAALKAQVQKP